MTIEKVEHTDAMNHGLQMLAEDVLEECGSCGMYHPKDWSGDCRDDAHRMHPDDLANLWRGAPDMVTALHMIATATEDSLHMQHPATLEDYKEAFRWVQEIAKTVLLNVERGVFTIK